MIKRVSLLSVVLLSLVTSCQSPVLNTTGLDKTENVQINTNTKITGNVEFPNLNTFKTKATESDISLNATISIIYPPDHPGSPNKTLSTALTDQNGNFTLKTDFNKIKNEIFVIEASKRIGQAGNFLMSLRTLIKWTDNGWQSITKDSVTINTKTTALTAMAGLIGKDKVTSDDTIGTIINNSLTDIKHSNNLVIKATSINEVAELVQLSIQKNQDPVAQLIFKNNRFTLKNNEKITNFITTIAGKVKKGFSGDGGKATDAEFNNITDVQYDLNGNMYISDSNNNRIRKIDTNGIVSTIAGNGVAGFSGDGGNAINAQLNNPRKITLDNFGNIYIADTNNNRIRKIDTNGIITTIAGNGTGSEEIYNEEIGDGGKATDAQIVAPTKVVIDSSGNMYISELLKIRKVDNKGIIKSITRLSLYNTYPTIQEGPSEQVRVDYVKDMTIDSSDNIYTFSWAALKKIDTKNNVITNISKKIPEQYRIESYGTINKSGNIIFKNSYGIYDFDQSTGNLLKIGGNFDFGYGQDNVSANDTKFTFINDITLDLSGNIIVSDENRIRKIIPTNKVSP